MPNRKRAAVTCSGSLDPVLFVLLLIPVCFRLFVAAWAAVLHVALSTTRRFRSSWPRHYPYGCCWPGPCGLLRSLRLPPHPRLLLAPADSLLSGGVHSHPRSSGGGVLARC